jgi:hypothetical protein
MSDAVIASYEGTGSSKAEKETTLEVNAAGI